MKTRKRPHWFIGTLAVLAAGLALACGAAAETGADDRWRLTVELSSFHDGHIATFNEIVALKNGRFDGGFRQGQASVALTFWVANDAVSGNMAVDAGHNWNWVTIKYDGPVLDGVFQKELVGPATYDLGAGVGRKHDGHVSRNVDVVMRLERQ